MTSEETTARVCAVLAFRLSLFSYYVDVCRYICCVCSYIGCGYTFELPQQVEAIQMSTVCTVIRSNMVSHFDEAILPSTYTVLVEI